MHAILFNTIFVLFTLLSTLAAPLPQLNPQVERSAGSSQQTTFLAPAPHWVVYSDQDSGSPNVVPDASELTGFNVFILSFLLTTGPSDQVQNFVNLPKSTRQAVISNLHANGISLMVSVLGSTEKPTTAGVKAKDFANEVASFVKKYELDGVDVDYEDLKAMDSKTGSAENWLVDFTTTLRSQLPQGQYLITHAPVAPWFTTDTSNYPHGSYRTVHSEVGDMIDWYNLQYYNQNNMYSTCSHVVSKSPSGGYPHTSVKEINQYTGVPLNKLVIGKPARSGDSDHGQDFMNRNEIASCLQQAKSFGWNAGAMFWEWPEASVELISTVRSLSFPLDLGL